MVWVHGGAWMIGDKANQLEDKIALFTNAGWALASINYRLSPNPPSTDPARLTYPAHPRDVAAAVQWLRGHATELGVDPARIAMLGHSAGAHLVALVSTDESFGVSGGIRCTGSFDTEAYDVVAALDGATAQQTQILLNAFTDDVQLQIAGSPINHVTAAAPPFLVAVRGSAERQMTQRRFATAVGASVIDASALSHEEVNASIGAAGDTVMTQPIMEFLTGCFE